MHITPTQALERLMAGNRRYVAGQPERPHQDRSRRAEVAAGQKPFAAVLSCSDSRVPPEIIFDCGLGDLFVVRTAGHVLEPSGYGSLDYAAEHLEIPLILVLGHKNCGAVRIVMEHGPNLPGAMSSLGAFVQVSLDIAHERPGDLLANWIRANTELTVGLLCQEPILSRVVAAGRVAVVGAYYDLDTGEVALLAE